MSISREMSSVKSEKPFFSLITQHTKILPPYLTANDPFPMQENKYVTIRNGVWISLYRRVDQSHTSRTPALQPFTFICICRLFCPYEHMYSGYFNFSTPFNPSVALHIYYHITTRINGT